MIVMQYRFTLPADYDMSIIERRIRHGGAKLDGFPGLLFKTYLYSRSDDRAGAIKENRYAPLYVWQNAEAMARFLQSPGFAGLCADFGWPRIESWLALRVPAVGEVMDKSWLSVKKRAIAPFSDLANLDLQGQLCAWDLSRWQLLEVSFGDAPSETGDNYRIGYVARGEA